MFYSNSSELQSFLVNPFSNFSKKETMMIFEGQEISLFYKESLSLLLILLLLALLGRGCGLGRLREVYQWSFLRFLLGFTTFLCGFDLLDGLGGLNRLGSGVGVELLRSARTTSHDIGCEYIGGRKGGCGGGCRRERFIRFSYCR
ncbi:hypothetical protein MLD38_029227 [Melastoma candidum]|uniref:Uncharacterized protein n=1 Tax=Melastoma candidum TaxID=119954 RepID=A0ACB9N4T1_9MYRT|nr:hypothetical protein MLD38_029227 [Melastoma candidum]